MDVVIDGKRYVAAEQSQHEEAMQLLNEVYGVLWCEAFRDPTNLKLNAFAVPLARKMSTANKLLHFKK